MSAGRALAALVACALWLVPAQAEIWGFVDAQGTAHFAAGKPDPRYELFFRGGESFDTAQGIVAPAQPAQLAQPAPGPAAGRLAAFLQASPGFLQVKAQLDAVAREHGIELELLQALIATESGFDPAAVSPKGAIGLMQVLPTTAQRYGLAGDARAPIEQKLKDPRTNLRTGTRYLRDLLRLFPGRLELALAAYNAGEGAVQKAGNRIPDYPETRNYVRTVMQLYALLRGPVAAQAAPLIPASAGTTQPPRRVRMELAGPAARRNLPPGLAAVAPLEGTDEPAVMVDD